MKENKAVARDVVVATAIMARGHDCGKCPECARNSSVIVWLLNVAETHPKYIAHLMLNVIPQFAGSADWTIVDCLEAVRWLTTKLDACLPVAQIKEEMMPMLAGDPASFDISNYLFPDLELPADLEGMFVSEEDIADGFFTSQVASA